MEPVARAVGEQAQQRAPQRLAGGHRVALGLAGRVGNLDDAQRAVAGLELRANGGGDRVARLARKPALLAEPVEQGRTGSHVSP